MIYESADEDYYIRKALQIMESRHSNPEKITGPEHMKDYLRLKLHKHEREVFGVVYLNTRHGILSMEDLFVGTIDSCTVHPREVVRGALLKSAKAVVLYHQHPSGDPEPSQADQVLTKRLAEALALIDVRVLDHLVIGHHSVVSFAERGYL
jgi:DNA repair protein RadC